MILAICMCCLSSRKMPHDGVTIVINDEDDDSGDDDDDDEDDDDDDDNETPTPVRATRSVHSQKSDQKTDPSPLRVSSRLQKAAGSGKSPLLRPSSSPLAKSSPRSSGPQRTPKSSSSQTPVFKTPQSTGLTRSARQQRAQKTPNRPSTEDEPGGSSKRSNPPPMQLVVSDDEEELIITRRVGRRVRRPPRIFDSPSSPAVASSVSPASFYTCVSDLAGSESDATPSQVRRRTRKTNKLSD